MPFPLTFVAEKNLARSTYRTDPETLLTSLYPYIMQSKGLKAQAPKRFCKSLITLPKKRLSSPCNMLASGPSSCTLSN